MDPTVTILVEGVNVDAVAAQKALAAAGSEVAPIGTSRGAVQDALKWIFKFTGDVGKVGDKLIDQATKQLAGATVKVQIGTATIEVTNANRSQLIDVLKQAQAIARQAGDL